jgi:hypothetical protein
MKDNAELNNRFYKACFTLSEEDILKFDKQDNGPINNVIANINKECFGVCLFESVGEYEVEMFYIAKPDKIKGEIICLKLNDPDYFPLLFKFCHLLSVTYNKVDAINAFNTFQSKLRGYLEKLGYHTVTTLELKQFNGQSVTMMSTSPKGIKKIDLIDKVEYYRDYFNESYKIPIIKGKPYVYLMVNTDTSLIKIGFSVNPGYRERTLHSQEPSIHLIACWEGSERKEKELHLKYRDKRVRGEWFRLNFADLYELDSFM